MTFTARVETYVNASSLSSPYNITVTKPSGTIDGDILFCWIGWYSGQGYTIDLVPDGWTLLASYTDNYDKYAIYYKVASSEGASWVWSFTNTVKVRAVCSCYTGGDFNPSNPIDIVSNTPYRTSTVYCISASINVSAPNSPLVFWGAVYNPSAKTFTKPTVPSTNWIEDDDAGSSTPDFWVEVCSLLWTGSGPTGDISATVSAALNTKHSFTVALNPSGGGVDVDVYDVVTLSDSIMKERYFSISDTVGSNDSLLSTDKAFSLVDSVNLVEDLLKLRELAPLPDFLSLIDSLYKQRDIQPIEDIMTLNDATFRDKPIIMITDSVNLNDLASQLRDFTVLDVYNLEDYPFIDKPDILIPDIVNLNDTTIISKMIITLDTININEKIIKTILGEGWNGKIIGVTNPEKVSSILREYIKKISQIEGH